MKIASILGRCLDFYSWFKIPAFKPKKKKYSEIPYAAMTWISNTRFRYTWSRNTSFQTYFYLLSAHGLFIVCIALDIVWYFCLSLWLSWWGCSSENQFGQLITALKKTILRGKVTSRTCLRTLGLLLKLINVHFAHSALEVLLLLFLYLINNRRSINV